MIDLSCFLLGEWDLSRTVTGGHDMQGMARFTDMQDGALHYREDGTVRMNGTDNALRFTRSYIYRPKGNILTVLFDEPTPRLFQTVVLADNEGGLQGDAQHLCPPDIYKSHYRFLRDGNFAIDHEVTGPRKSYVIATRYVRSKPPA